VRFFGKLLGTGADYYVVLGMGATPPVEAAGDVPSEESGAGLNACACFVATDPTASFVLLPDVTPAQVVASTKIKKYLTGDLDAPVACYPPFPGVEKNLLRALIARIGNATELVPDGKFAVDAESEAVPPPVILAEGWEPPSSDDVAWVHKPRGLLKIGRETNPKKPEPEEGEEPAEEEVVEDEKEPLAPVADDKDVWPLDPATLPEDAVEKFTVKAWSATKYVGVSKRYAVAVMKSNVWPGAYAAYQSGKCANVYIGYGVDSTGVTFTPAPPPPVMSECGEAEEQEEVALNAENKLLLSIDEAKRVAEAGEGEGEE